VAETFSRYVFFARFHPADKPCISHPNFQSLITSLIRTCRFYYRIQNSLLIATRFIFPIPIVTSFDCSWPVSLLDIHIPLSPWLGCLISTGFFSRKKLAPFLVSRRQTSKTGLASSMNILHAHLDSPWTGKGFPSTVSFGAFPFLFFLILVFLIRLSLSHVSRRLGFSLQCNMELCNWIISSLHATPNL
jgi:hypothetical protein